MADANATARSSLESTCFAVFGYHAHALSTRMTTLATRRQKFGHLCRRKVVISESGATSNAAEVTRPRARAHRTHVKPRTPHDPRERNEIGRRGLEDAPGGRRGRRPNAPCGIGVDEETQNLGFTAITDVQGDICPLNERLAWQARFPPLLAAIPSCTMRALFGFGVVMSARVPERQAAVCRPTRVGRDVVRQWHVVPTCGVGQFETAARRGDTR